MSRCARTIVLSLLPSLVACTTEPPGQPPAEKPLQVLLVRHAEKVDDGDDPALSPAGVERAAALAATLRDAGIERIHTSDYLRTRETAAPLAETLGIEVEIYDPRDLDALVARLGEAGGRHLVVGHSNTTPAAVELLGGEPGAEIDEASEYDRLYLVTRGADGTVGTVLLRYGEPSSDRSGAAT